MKTTSSNQKHRYFHPTVLYTGSKYTLEKEGREGGRETPREGGNKRKKERRERELMEADEQRTVKWKNEEMGERKSHQAKCREKHWPWV